MDPLDFELRFVENKTKYNLGAVTDGSITTAKLADGAVTTAKIASGAGGMTICTSTTKPVSPTVGQMIFETDTNLQRVWIGSAWSIGVRHASNISVEYIVIGGGGSGAGCTGTSIASGGGGAGGYRSSVAGEATGGGGTLESPLSLPLGNYTVTIGAGGAQTTAAMVVGNSGTNSVFHTITSLGGGGGGTWSGQALTGGSGGGAGENGQGLGPGLGTAGQGYAGGDDSSYDNGGPSAGAGGGGAGGVGANTANTSTGGNGGIGIQTFITGILTYFAGGGGGGGSSTAGTGGNGGGGAGRQGTTGMGTAGTVNTGGGGGGSLTNANEANQSGPAGGSGVVLVRYPTNQALGLNISGGTKTTAGSYTVHTFTASGTLSIA